MQTAVQMGSVRRLSEPLPDLLERVAAAGYDGVTFGGLDEASLKDLAAALGRTGLEPVAARVPLDRLQGQREQVVRELRTVGCERVVVPPLHGDRFADERNVARMATRLSALSGRLAADGRRLCYRTGTREFAPLEAPGVTGEGSDGSETGGGNDSSDGDETGGGSDGDEIGGGSDSSDGSETSEASPGSDGSETAEGSEKGDGPARTGFDVLVDRAGDGLAFEVDLGAVVAAGHGPVAVVDGLGGRVPLVAVRDLDGAGDHVELGTGTIDVARVVEAAGGAGTEWLVHEPTDPDVPADSLARGAEHLRALVD